MQQMQIAQYVNESQNMHKTTKYVQKKMHKRIDSFVFFNLLSEQPLQEKWHEEKDMTHVHGPYSWKKLDRSV